MRVFVVSDIHIDYKENKTWVRNLSSQDYVKDILILAGDVTDNLSELNSCFSQLARKFLKVLYVPGNHELWVLRDKSGDKKRDEIIDSMEKYQRVCTLAANNGISMEPFHFGPLSIVPLLSWYDFSFGQPCKKLNDAWMDFHACQWPGGLTVEEVTAYFLQKNEQYLTINKPTTNHTLISFSHFLPRIDLMPFFISFRYRYIYPVLGSALLDQQVRKLKPDIHLYGHSHLNRNVVIDGIRYINNAFGYPQESGIASKQLLCVYDK